MSVFVECHHPYLVCCVAFESFDWSEHSFCDSHVVDGVGAVLLILDDVTEYWLVRWEAWLTPVDSDGEGRYYRNLGDDGLYAWF